MSNYLQYPPSGLNSNSSTITADYGSGDYTSTASSNYSTMFDGLFPFYAFDYDISTSNDGWRSTLTYDNSTGANLSGYSLGGYSGEWLKIELPEAITLNKYIIYPHGTGINTRSPSTFYLLGSNDNSNWDLLDSQSNLNWNINENTQGEKEFIINNNNSYKYYAIVVNVVGNSDETSNRDSAQILEWELYALDSVFNTSYNDNDKIFIFNDRVGHSSNTTFTFDKNFNSFNDGTATYTFSKTVNSNIDEFIYLDTDSSIRFTLLIEYSNISNGKIDSINLTETNTNTDSITGSYFFYGVVRSSSDVFIDNFPKEYKTSDILTQGEYYLENVNARTISNTVENFTFNLTVTVDSSDKITLTEDDGDTAGDIFSGLYEYDDILGFYVPESSSNFIGALAFNNSNSNLIQLRTHNYNNSEYTQVYEIYNDPISLTDPPEPEPVSLLYKDFDNTLKPGYTSIYFRVNDLLTFKVGLILTPNGDNFEIKSKKSFIHLYDARAPENNLNTNINSLWTFIQNELLGDYTFNNSTGKYEKDLPYFEILFENTDGICKKINFNSVINEPEAEIVINSDFTTHWLKPLTDKNYIFDIGKKYINDSLSSITNITSDSDILLNNTNFSHPTSSIKNSDNTQFLNNKKCVYSYTNNDSTKTVANFFEESDEVLNNLKNINTFTSNKQNERPNIDLIPYYNSEKYFYYQTYNGSSTTTNIILRIPTNLLSKNSLGSNDNYYIDTTDTNSVVLFNFNNSKIGKMSYSSQGKYFYKQLQADDLPKGVFDFTSFKLSFVFKFKNKNNGTVVPITISAPYSVLPPTINTSYDLESSSSSFLGFPVENTSYTISNSNNNLVLNFFSNLTKLNNLGEQYDITNVYLKYTINSKVYYVYLDTINLYEHNSVNEAETHLKNGIKISWKSILKFIPTSVSNLNVVFYFYSESSPKESTFPLSLNNFSSSDLKNLRKDIYEKPLVFQEHNSNTAIETGDLEANDYLIYKIASTSQNTILSKPYYYKITLLNSDNTQIGTGFSFYLNYFNTKKEKRTRRGRGTTITYFDNFSLYYTKDLIVNDIVSNLDTNIDYLGKNTVKIDFKTINSNYEIKLNQEITSLETEISTSNLNTFVEDNADTTNTKIKDDFTKALNDLITTNETGKVSVNIEEIVINDNTSVSNLIGADLDEEGNININGDTIEVDDLTVNYTFTKANIVKYSYKHNDGSTNLVIIDKEKKQKITVKSYNKKGIVQSKVEGEGSLIIKTQLLVSYKYTYDLDKGILPGNEVNSLNFRNQGFRIFSINDIEATAVNLEDINLDNPETIVLNIYQDEGTTKTLYSIDISEYNEDTFNILQAGNSYRIYINQTGKSEKFFDFTYNVSGSEFSVNQSLIDDDLGITFNDTLKINSYLNFWYNQTTTMINLLTFLQDNYKVVSKVSDIDYTDEQIGKLQFIFTNNNTLTFGRDTYDLEQIFDNEINLIHNYYVMEMYGLGKKGSGIVQIKLLSTSIIPCITGDTLIKTPFGEKQIKDLEEGELIKTANGENVPIIKKLERECYDKTKMPFIIPKDFYGENKPSSDLHISGNHAYKINNKSIYWKYPKDQNFNKLNKSDITYYNLKLPDYHKHQFIANNLIIESWNDGDNKIKKYRWIKQNNGLKKVYL